MHLRPTMRCLGVGSVHRLSLRLSEGRRAPALTRSLVRIRSSVHDLSPLWARPPATGTQLDRRNLEQVLDR